MIPQILISMGKQVCQQGTTLNQHDTKEQHAKQYTRTKQRHDTRSHGSTTNIYYKGSMTRDTWGTNMLTRKVPSS
jgi:hypothetical protein